MMKLYVGNLAWESTESDLTELFSKYGNVVSATIITDKNTGRGKGFGFVEMGDKAEGEAAIKALNEKEFAGRNLNVNEARPREDRPSQNRY